jgi:tight adherence protein B
VSTLLLLALVFLGTVGVLVGAYVFANRQALTASDAALERLREVEEHEVTLRGILRDARVSELPFLERFLAGKGITAWLADELLHAGVNMTPGAFVLRCGVGAVAGLVLGQLVFGTPAVAFILMVIGGIAPFLWLRSKRSKRSSLFQSQLPDAIDMLVSAMKAGYSFQAAMKFIGEEMSAPLGPEFARFYEEQRLGLEVRAALLAMQTRVDSVDLKMFITALLIQRETGGNLAEVMEKISGLMRERATLKGEIETLTAESKLSARILGALPFVVFAAVNLLNPGFMKPMLETDAGPWIFAGAAVTVGFGYWIMMRIADIDI